MNKYLAVSAAALLASCGCLNAQVVNRAASFTSAGTVDCGAMPALDDLSSFSVQFSLNPENWTEGATLLSRGEGFSVKLGSSGKIRFTTGGKTITADAPELTPSAWNQVTLICDEGNAKVLVNGEENATGQLNDLGKSEDPFVMGGGYSGLLDEVRIWNAALNDEMKVFDYFISNTLNKFCPMWENLVAYYKMDQENCPGILVEYKVLEESNPAYDNHGVMSEGVSKVVANNEKMPYLVNAAYTENSRFFDRIIPVDQYLLSNEIIILGADCISATGHVVPRTPNNHALSIDGVKYEADFEGRKGVISFDGKSKMTLPAKTIPTEGAYTFETWIYVDEWVPGAYILRKENDAKDKGLAVYLGPADEKRIIARVNGNEYACMDRGALSEKEWIHLGVTSGTGATVSESVFYYKDGKNIYSDPMSDLTTGEKSKGYLSAESEDLNIIIGENFKGKLDETMVWKKALATNEVSAHMKDDVPMPALNKNVRVEDMNNTSAFYKYDNPENLGYSYHSQDEWANIMRGAYEGYTPAKISFSVRGHGVDNPNASDYYPAIMNNEEKRKIFAEDLAELSKNYDGVELDLEWVYDANGWSNYSKLADEIINALPEGKTFRISMHNVTYSYPKSKLTDPGLTGVTFQQYGPQATHSQFSTFTKKVKEFLDYGFPADKIMTSYATTTSKGVNGADIRGVRNGTMDGYVPGDQDVDKYTNGNDTWSYNGPIQVYNRAKYTRENSLQGIFYWDMGNDNWTGTPAEPVMEKYHLAKYCSYGINSNIDRIVTNLTVNHYGDTGVGSIIVDNVRARSVVVTPSPAESEITVVLSNGEIPGKVLIHNLSGAKTLESRNTASINVENLNPGIYTLSAIDGAGNEYVTKFVKR